MSAAVRWFLLNSAIALAYFVFGKIGLAMALPPGYVSAIWPAAGFALAVAVVYGGSRVWCGILVGSALTNATVTGDFNLNTVALGIACGSTLQGLVGAAWLRRRIPDLIFDRPERLMQFFIVGVISCLVAASVGNLVLLMHGFTTMEQVPQSFVTWWLGDAFGVQIFVPLTLLALGPNAHWKRHRLSVGLPLLAAFSLCGVIYVFVKNADERQLMRTFAAMTEPFLYEIRSLDRNNGQALRQLAASYRVRAETPGPEFVVLADELRKKLPAFRAISWAPVLDAAGQANYPQLAARAGSLATLIRRPPGFAPSADGLAAPVTLVAPLAGNEAALGLDLLGEAERSIALRYAIETGDLAVTKPLRLAQDPDGPGGLLFAGPISSAGRASVLTAVIDLRLADTLLGKLGGVVWELREVLPGSDQVLWQSKKVNMPVFEAESHINRAGVYKQQHVSLGGREWRMVLYRPHSEFVREASVASMLVLFLALFSCGVFSSMVLIISGDRERVAALVAEQTAALNAEIAERKNYEIALESAKQSAEAANIAKSQFLATMSHEIRTPMNGILGMAQLLMMDDIDADERKSFVRTILGSGKSLLTILNDILDLSKIEAGKLELELSTFDPAALLDEIASLFREAAQKKGLLLVAYPTLDRARYLGDPLRLRQMISNYVGNAIKFSEHGTITLHLRELEGAADAPQSLLEFAVTDQGIGIPQDKLDVLFAPFVQVDGSATRRFGGTGLGLSIVRRLAQQMGGDVGVESRAGEGSRFWFRILVERVSLAAEARRVSRGPIAGAVIEAAAGPTSADWVLVVEDNATNRMVVTSMLARLAVNARCAENGQEALHLLAANRTEPSAAPPRLILMDCQMPVLDGFATTREIRRHEAEHDLPHQRIVALTAGAFDDDRQHCIEAGMDDFLAKPLVFEDLARILRDPGAATPPDPS